jgi:hypothetical protein
VDQPCTHFALCYITTREHSATQKTRAAQRSRGQRAGESRWATHRIQSVPSIAPVASPSAVLDIPLSMSYASAGIQIGCPHRMPALAMVRAPARAVRQQPPAAARALRHVAGAPSDRLGSRTRCRASSSAVGQAHTQPAGPSVACDAGSTAGSDWTSRLDGSTQRQGRSSTGISRESSSIPKLIL